MAVINNIYTRYECNFDFHSKRFLDCCLEAAIRRDPVCITSNTNFISHLMAIDKKAVRVNHSANVIFVSSFDPNSVTIIMTPIGWHIFKYAFTRVDDLYYVAIGEEEGGYHETQNQDDKD